VRGYLILIAATFMLVACSSGAATIDTDTEEQPEVESEEAKVEYDREHEISVIDNGDLKIQLLKSRKEVLENHRDWMKLMFVMENKKERTFEFYFDEIKLDKVRYEFDDITPSDAKIEPGEIQEVILIVESHEEINFGEYIAGEFVYVDFEENVYEESFSEYINE